jgi:hypothetical protein
MNDHRRALTLGASAIDFPLEAPDRAWLDAHAVDCAECGVELAGFWRDAARLSALPPLAPPLWVRGSLGRTRRPNPFVLLAAAALLVTAAGLAIGVGSRLVSDRTALVLPSALESHPRVTAPAVVPPATPAPSVSSVSSVPSGTLLVRRTDQADTEPLPVTYGLIDVATGTFRSLGLAVAATLSADGSRIHLVRDDARCVPTLVTLDLQGTEVERIEGGFLPGDGPFAWSPDDGSVVFGRYVNGEPQGMCHSQGGTYQADELLSATYLIGRVGGWKIGPPLVAASAPAEYGWSPDGAWVSVADSSPRLWTVDPASGNRIDFGAALASVGAHDLWDARWSPVGESIAFAYSSPVGVMVGVAAVANGAVREIGQYGDVSNAPAWSPDGTSIAVVRSHKGGVLLLLDPAGTRPEALLEQMDVDELAPFGWSPDGLWLADSAIDGHLLALSADGLGLQSVFAPPAGASLQFAGWAQR